MKDVVRAEWDPPGEEWPLLFRHFEEVRGTDFKVCVMMMGRLLATIDPETGSCTIDGVYPGSLFAEGASLSEANDNVRADISKILEDVMVSSKNVTDFRAHIEDFMQTTDEVAVASWKKALDRVRSGQEEGAPAEVRCFGLVGLRGRGGRPGDARPQAPHGDPCSARSEPASSLIFDQDQLHLRDVG